MLNPSDSLVDWVHEDRADDGRRLVPAGHAGHRHRRHRREGHADGQGSADGRRSTCSSCKARGPQNKTEELRIELCDKVNALGIGAQGLGGLTTVLDVKIAMYPTHAAEQAGGDDPQLRRHAPRALRARRQRPGLPRPAEPGPVARRALGARLQQEQAGQPGHADQGRSRELEARRHAAAQRQDAHRPRRRAQAHPGHAGQGREAAGGLHQPRHLLRRPGRPGARRGGRPGRPDHRHAHGQVHRDDAGADRPDRHDRQGRARARPASRPSGSTRAPT